MMQIDQFRRFLLFCVLAVSIGTNLLATSAAAQALAAPENTEPGVTLRLFAIEWPLDALGPLEENQTPNVDVLREAFDLDAADLVDPALAGPVVMHVRGYLRIDEPGVYQFVTGAPASKAMHIGGETIMRDGEGNTVRLDRGWQPFWMEAVFNGPTDERQMTLRYRREGEADYAAIPADRLRTDADPTRVVSPGYKRIVGQRRPGDRTWLAGVHPGYDLFTLHTSGDDSFVPMVGGTAFLPDGRLVVGTFDPLQRSNTALPDIESKEPDKLYALTNVTGDDASKIEVTTVADGLYEPAGVTVYDGQLYVSQRKAITRLTDTDGDGFFETHTDVGRGWQGWNYHEFTFSLLGLNGKLYAALSTPMAPPPWEGMRENSAPGGPFRGTLVEVDLKDDSVRYVAGGFRTPNGLGVGPDGSIYYADNQGTWFPASTFTRVVPGHFYGHYNNDNFVEEIKEWQPNGGSPSMYSDQPRTPATLLLPHGEVANSPTQSLLIPDGPYAGQMLLGELTAGGIRRAFLEEVNGQMQGAIFRFTQGLEVGVNRLAWGPDGGLYIGGIGAGGNWNWRGTQAGLQRLKANGKEVFEMKAVRALPDGFEIEYTKPADREFLANRENFELRQWTYQPTEKYGGPKVDEHVLEVTAAEPNEDGTRVRLTVLGAKPGYVVHIVADTPSAEGERIWSTEAWYTLNSKPVAGAPAEVTLDGNATPAGSIGVGAVAPEGAVQLLGSGHLAHWLRGDQDHRDAPNLTQFEVAALDPAVAASPETGELRSRASFGDARYHVEWNSPPGGEGQMAGNSGVYLQRRYELQILNTPADKEELARNEAGAIYNVKPADVNASLGAGAWQSYDIWFKAARFEDGEKVSPARVTVLWNGLLIHHDVVLDGPTGAGQAEEPGPYGGEAIGQLLLQAHASDADGPVQFRNVWVQPLNPPQTDHGEWIELVDDNLEAWQNRGGDATFELADGVLRGTTAGTANTFLCTRATYGDFELEYETRVDPELNSGVQIRSHDRDDRVTGYQVEADSSDRAWSGGVYDEAGRGWLQPMSANAAARRAWRVGEWNRVRVVADGPTIRTYINDVAAAATFDAASRDGFIGLQVHGVPADAPEMRVEWRNVRLRELR